jgi:phage head maturation protease
VLRKVSLMEVSLVPTPMLDVARVDAVKARAGHAKRLSPQLQRVLATIERSEQREDWSRTKAQIKAMRVRLGY